MFCLGATLLTAMILLPLYFQEIRHQDAFDTGLLLIPQSIAIAAMLAMPGADTRDGRAPEPV